MIYQSHMEMKVFSIIFIDLSGKRYVVSFLQDATADDEVEFDEDNETEIE